MYSPNSLHAQNADSRYEIMQRLGEDFAKHCGTVEMVPFYGDATMPPGPLPVLGAVAASPKAGGRQNFDVAQITRDHKVGYKILTMARNKATDSLAPCSYILTDDGGWVKHQGSAEEMPAAKAAYFRIGVVLKWAENGYSDQATSGAVTRFKQEGGASFGTLDADRPPLTRMWKQIRRGGRAALVSVLSVAEHMPRGHGMHGYLDY